MNSGYSFDLDELEETFDNPFHLPSQSDYSTQIHKSPRTRLQLQHDLTLQIDEDDLQLTPVKISFIDDDDDLPQKTLYEIHSQILLDDDALLKPPKMIATTSKFKNISHPTVSQKSRHEDNKDPPQIVEHEDNQAMDYFIDENDLPVRQNSSREKNRDGTAPLPRMPSERIRKLQFIYLK